MNKKLLVSFLLLLAPSVYADTLDLTWTAPTAREDGTALAGTEIAGYRLVWTVRGVAQADKFIAGNVTAYTLDTGTLSGRTCVKLATRDTASLESVLTAEVCRNAKPNPPSNVAIR